MQLEVVKSWIFFSSHSDNEERDLLRVQAVSDNHCFGGFHGPQQAAAMLPACHLNACLSQ